MTAQGSPRLNLALLLLRAVPALLLVGFHGWDKLVAATRYLAHGTEWKFIEAVAGLGFPLPAFFAVCAALAESVVALFLAAGLFTRYAAAIVAFNFTVAVYRHVTTDFRFELAALYWLIAVVFVFTPPGRFALDAVRRA